LRARVQSPLTRAPSKIPGVVEKQEIEGGAEAIVSGCESKMRPEKKTRRRMCWPASQPASQSGTRICNTLVRGNLVEETVNAQWSSGYRLRLESRL